MQEACANHATMRMEKLTMLQSASILTKWYMHSKNVRSAIRKIDTIRSKINQKLKAQLNDKYCKYSPKLYS